METTQTLDIAAIERFLRVRGWKLLNEFSNNGLSHEGERFWYKGRDEWRIELSDMGASIEKFTDSDLPDDHYKGGFVAVGRFETVGEECYSLDELQAALVALGVIPFECPYCGEVGGESATFTSCPYRYGADADGNRGEMRTDSEQRCTKCVRKP